MKTLMQVAEQWVRELIFECSKDALFGQQFKDVEERLERADRISHSAFVDVQDLTKEFKATEELHIRDANRIASLELTVMRLNERLLDTERNVIIQADGEVFSVKERMDALESTLDDHESKIDDLESVVEDKVDRDEVEDMIESNEHDTDEIERTVRDSIEEFIVDAVRNEIDAADFKVIVER
jgi:hypothetical protein